MTAETIGYGLVILILAIAIGATLFIAYDIWHGISNIDEYQDQDNWGAK
jgi:hypothetical protein